MTTEDKKKTRRVRVGFFTGNGSKKDGLSTAKLAFEQMTNTTPVTFPLVVTAETQNRGLKLVILEKDDKQQSYFGYVSWRRDCLLPFIEDGTTGSERTIPLSDKDSVVERTYFIYYFETDLLAMTLNHLGPKVNDLSFILYNKTQMKNVTFEAIWKHESMKELLEDGNILRSFDLTVAAPRNFNKANYQIKNDLTNDIIDMVVGMGGSHLRLNMRGRIRPKRAGFNYLKSSVTDAIKELLELFPKGSGGLNIKKIDVTEPSDTAPKSLLDQVLIGSKTIVVKSGYPSDSDIRTAMISAKIDNANYLAQYELAKKNQ
ncbi:TPA: hypothetical protein ACW72B_004918 [Citrobacter freundii]|uniref:hypothetical protein n=1 Tax=Citrobacter freundii TaxID=546 RepID=UPI001A2EF836|nr:hypothetical protein [Citrobacter freundii]EKV5129326.1 hypothetical protein [Citrobacter freundii]ELZ9358999.1 hypothetical protein [Citrobacter freundii]MDM7198071.1 hypothetical protein [Citrobacter freundii]HAT2339363.1 hypothetical protein [Citrobacter freundii]HAT2361824.1 hypothetical protein [Citrobacter freundii]